jgi:hypothetical protein
LGEETRELLRVASSGLCPHHLSSGGPTGIGSKTLQRGSVCLTVRKMDSLRLPV